MIALSNKTKTASNKTKFFKFITKSVELRHILRAKHRISKFKTRRATKKILE